MSKFKKKTKDEKVRKEVKAYLRLRSPLNTREIVAQDALDNKAYTKFVQALQKELTGGQINPEGSVNFDWNAIARFVVIHVTVREYYEKTVRILLFVNVSRNDKFNCVTLSIGDDKIDIPLDPIPDTDSDASFIYENAAKKVNEYLVSKRYDGITF
ncbi:MAG: hypothetical protein K2H24_02415 [Clostridia bacterium]|nr:hypothetical protein [Clostridia bacterium]MDE6758268.1 hypothetical protein [Clostridia bacterium]